MAGTLQTEHSKVIAVVDAVYLEERQQVLYVGTVAQGSSWGLVGQPVEAVGSLQDGSGPVGQQAQQLSFTAALDSLESGQRPHCTCIPHVCHHGLHMLQLLSVVKMSCFERNVKF